jgi:hypothetical protein
VRITGEVEDIHVLISKGRGYTCGIMSLSFINSEPIQHSSVSTAGGSGSMPSPAAPARSYTSIHGHGDCPCLHDHEGTSMEAPQPSRSLHGGSRGPGKGFSWMPHGYGRGSFSP